MSDKKVPVIGFVGLGVMGGAMCRNVALKHGGEVIAYDLNANPRSPRWRGTKARRATTLAEVAHEAEIVFLSLPGSLAGRTSLSGAAGARRSTSRRRPSSWI